MTCKYCDKKIYCRGLCKGHYRRLLKYGTPTGGRTQNGEGLKFLQDLISGDLNDDCVIWPFGTDDNGYGCVWLDGRHIGAHRLSLQLFSGLDGDGLVARHGPCHNSSCVNPLHLSWGTLSDNQRDRTRDNTDNRGERQHGAKLNREQILKIRKDERLYRDIALEFGISEGTVGDIKCRRSWSWLSDAV